MGVYICIYYIYNIYIYIYYIYIYIYILYTYIYIDFRVDRAKIPIILETKLDSNPYHATSFRSTSSKSK